MPRDSFRTRTQAVLVDIRKDLKNADLIPAATFESSAKTRARIQRLATWKERHGRFATLDGYSYDDDLTLCISAAKLSRPVGTAPHSREFAAGLMYYIDTILGKEAGRIARDRFIEAKLKYSKPKQMSPEARQAASDRMIKRHADRVRAELIQLVEADEL